MATRTLYTSESSGNIMICDNTITGSALETLASNPYANLAAIRFHSGLNYLDIQDEISGTVTFPGYVRNVDFVDQGSCNSFSFPYPTPKIQSVTLGVTSVVNPISYLVEYNGSVTKGVIPVTSPNGVDWTRNIYSTFSGSVVNLTSNGFAINTDMPSYTLTAKVYIIG